MLSKQTTSLFALILLLSTNIFAMSGKRQPYSEPSSPHTHQVWVPKQVVKANSNESIAKKDIANDTYYISNWLRDLFITFNSLNEKSNIEQEAYSITLIKNSKSLSLRIFATQLTEKYRYGMSPTYHEKDFPNEIELKKITTENLENNNSATVKKSRAADVIAFSESESDDRRSSIKRNKPGLTDILGSTKSIPGVIQSSASTIMTSKGETAEVEDRGTTLVSTKKTEKVDDKKVDDKKTEKVDEIGAHWNDFFTEPTKEVSSSTASGLAASVNALAAAEEKSSVNKKDVDLIDLTDVSASTESTPVPVVAEVTLPAALTESTVERLQAVAELSKPNLDAYAPLTGSMANLAEKSQLDAAKAKLEKIEKESQEESNSSSSEDESSKDSDNDDSYETASENDEHMSLERKKKIRKSIPVFCVEEKTAPFAESLRRENGDSRIGVGEFIDDVRDGISGDEGSTRPEVYLSNPLTVGTLNRSALAEERTPSTPATVAMTSPASTTGSSALGDTNSISTPAASATSALVVSANPTHSHPDRAEFSSDDSSSDYSSSDESEEDGILVNMFDDSHFTTNNLRDVVKAKPADKFGKFLNFAAVCAASTAVVTYSSDIKNGVKKAQVRYFTRDAWEDTKHLIECDVVIPVLGKFDDLTDKIKNLWHNPKKITKKEAAIIAGAIATPVALYYTGACGKASKIVKTVAKNTIKIAEKFVNNKVTKSAFIVSCLGASAYKINKNKNEQNIAKIKNTLLNCLTSEGMTSENFDRLQTAVKTGNLEMLIDLRNDPNIAQYLSEEQQGIIDEYVSVLVFGKV
ncbi:hypothetical protein M1446_02000 [Candidatus Dependentiae bacterium]|nr:hypothetical protein [Candidatus Dependentiae bacterium]